MKYLILIYTTILFIIIVGCSIYNNKFKIEFSKPYVISKVIPKAFNERIKIVKIPIIEKDTTSIINNITNKYTTIDTTYLKLWLKDIYNNPESNIYLMNDPKFISMVSQLEKLWIEYEATLNQLIKALEEKEKAKKVVHQAEVLSYKIGTIIFLLAIPLFIFGSLVIYKQHNSRVIIENRVKNLKEYISILISNNNK